MPTTVKTIGNVEVSTGEGSFIEKSFVDAPFTNIQNRAQVSNTLKATMGVERVHTNSLELKTKEFGPNGEPVYGPDNGDDRIRFYGDWLTIFDTNGTVPNSNALGDIVEVTFYGTGLNMLSTPGIGSDIKASIDSGPFVLVKSDINNVLAFRNYKPNVVIPVAKGLPLSWHTVAIRRDDVVSRYSIYGFEIITSTSQIVVSEGKAYSDGKLVDVSSSVTDYNTGFENVGSVGQKGGRVITYVDPADSLVKKVVTPTDPRVTEGDPTELVTNGTFDTDISGWTNYGGAVWNNGKLRIDSNLGTRVAEQAITTVIGKTYTLTFDYDIITNAGGDATVLAIFEGANATGAQLGDAPRVGGIGSGSLQTSFTATTTTTYLYVSVEDNLDVVDYDNISVKETAYNFLALADTDHSEEVVYRKINFREFGRNRGDDFSTLSTTASNRTFTLDDGTTTLVGNNCIVTSERLFANSNTNFFTLTFVGTGLDIVGDMNASEITIDGINVGKNIDSNGEIVKAKICSGLPYGTHTVKFQRVDANSAGADGVSDFIIYQPKKPALPEGAIELADYNLMADFVANDTADTNAISTGVLAKKITRELVYSGSWAVQLFGGIEGFWTNGTAGSYLEYTFYGTGLDYRFQVQSDGGTATLSIDGNTDFTPYNTEIYGSNEIGFVDTTGVLDNDVTSGSPQGCGLIISGLPLGIHTFRVTVNSGITRAQSLDIITPIHINSPDLKTGSLALLDKRRESDIEHSSGNKVDLGKAKAWVVYNQATNEIIGSYNISTVLESASIMYFYFKQPFKEAAYSVSGMAGGGVSGRRDEYILHISGTNPRKEMFSVIVRRNDNISTTDSTYVTLTFFGELENEEDIDLDDL